MGEKDDHTGLEDFIYLNDNSIELFYKSIIGKPLRSFTHSKKEYEHMLKDSGFEDVTFFGSLPDYKLPKLMIDLTDNSCTQFAQKNLEFVQDDINPAKHLAEFQLHMLADAQTSGGLLISVSPKNAEALVNALKSNGTLASHIIGEVQSNDGNVKVNIL